ncbi:hypothetical protein E4T48_05265 [Aureobasidium sp. EXF-10727]|nr:hypothetical protein E4T48_05265 [Aureobasidium sp. EXF-10727]
MASVRNSTYSTHSVADAHLLAMLDGKQEQDLSRTDTQGSRLSTLFSTKLLETILVIPSTSSRKHEDDIFEDGMSTTSFDDMQRSVQIIGLPKPERSKPRQNHLFEFEHVINDAAMDDRLQDPDYDSEPQHRVEQMHSRPSTVSKAVVIVTQHTTDRVGELATVDTVEDTVALSGRPKLTFLEVEGNEGTEEDTITAQAVVGMAEVVIQVAVHITLRGRC